MAEAYKTSLQVQQGRSNPFNFWIWAIVDSSQVESQSELIGDPDILQMNNSLSMILDCEISVYNLSYAFQNGSLDSSSVKTRLADDAPTYVVADPMAFNFAQNQLYERLRVSAATETSSSGIAFVMSSYLSEMAVAYVAGIFEPWPNEAESTRRQTQVTRLSEAMVWLVIVNGYVLVFCSTIYSVYAIWLVRRCPGSASKRDYMTLDALFQRSQQDDIPLHQMSHETQSHTNSQ